MILNIVPSKKWEGDYVELQDDEGRPFAIFHSDFLYSPPANEIYEQLVRGYPARVKLSLIE